MTVTLLRVWQIAVWSLVALFITSVIARNESLAITSFLWMILVFTVGIFSTVIWNIRRKV